MYRWNMTPREFPVDGMSGSYFRDKTEGPVYFEIVGTNYYVGLGSFAKNQSKTLGHETGQYACL